MKLYYPSNRIYSTSCNFKCHYQWPNNNNGIDWRFPIGTPVLAPADGRVVMSQHGGSGGNQRYGHFIKIRHGNTAYHTLYGHLKKRLVKVGDNVKTGEKIALSGNSGVPRPGAHLHFETMRGNVRFDPEQILYKPYKTPPPPNGGNGGNGNVPDPYMGIDVSHHNPGANIKLAAERGFKFAYIRITRGDGYVDREAKNHFEKCQKYGLITSFYHYWYATVPGKEQAVIMKNAMDEYKGYIDMPPVIDVEDPDARKFTPGNNARSIYDMAKGLQEYDGWPECAIYTSASFWNANVNTKWEWQLLMLWVAHWGAGGNPAIPQPWLKKKVPHTIHQFGTIDLGGQDIDGNKWNTAEWDFPPKKDDEPPQPPTDSFIVEMNDILIGDDIYEPHPPDVTYYMKKE